MTTKSLRTALVALFIAALGFMATTSFANQLTSVTTTNAALSAEARSGSMPMIANPAITSAVNGFSADQKYVWVAFEFNKQPGEIVSYFSCSGIDRTNAHTDGVVVDSELDGLPGVYTYMVAFDLAAIRKVCGEGNDASLLYGANAAISGYPNVRRIEYQANGTVWYTNYSTDGKVERFQLTHNK